jgi:hypothetical protein
VPKLLEFFPAFLYSFLFLIHQPPIALCRNGHATLGSLSPVQKLNVERLPLFFTDLLTRGFLLSENRALDALLLPQK